ncbi:3',5'-cyclic AMP phosphodiesterase CpdA [Paracoccus isoporae]|uniref:3',5'-cyclic AMP phosphodiesterase CpdA n=1 Tax=Paracoccus isoporae TaxID=591205 RepID=A0A1G6TTZ7_9RHOB|nr:metallophosphoesterase [Paracoccus isoporae]SDD31795.1 3',5'-cyclic AMP phosphodiesterase CpdA [Paracoccus isoporae]
MRLALLADLHIGMHRAHLVQPLLDAIATARPDNLVIAGDLVQRARRGLFAEAQALLDRTGVPWLCVPGNHDIPLLDLPGRLLSPFRAYQRAVQGPREPLLELPGLKIIGVNSTFPYRWRNGRITQRQIDRVRHLSRSGPVMVVQHHPISLLPGETKELMLNAEAARAAYDAAGVSLVLTGHLHQFNIAGSVSGMTQIHAGSVLCDRPEDPPNEFALLDIEGDVFTLTRMIAASDGAGFIAQPPIQLPKKR